MQCIMSACAAAMLLGLTANVAAAEPLPLDARQLDSVTAGGDRFGSLAAFAVARVLQTEGRAPAPFPSFIFDIGDVTPNLFIFDIGDVTLNGFIFDVGDVNL